MSSKKDPGQILLSSFDEATQSLRVSGAATPIQASIKIVKDSALVDITKDTVTPANTIPMPVEIVAASGTPISITANNLNMQLTHAGANPDSTQIGDGTNLLGVTAANEAKVRTAQLPTVLGTQVVAASTAVNIASDQIVPVSGPLTDVQLRATSVPVSGPLTDAQLRAIAVPVSATALPLPTGAATSANQATEIASLASIDAKLTNPLPVSGAFYQATQPVSVATLPLPTSAATETSLAAAAASVASIDTKLTNPLPVSVAALPLPAGAAT